MFVVFAFAGGIYAIQTTTVANAMFLFAAAPFLAAVRALRPDAPSPELEQTIANGFRRGRLFVFATWAALLLAALIGVVKPGVAEDQKAPAVNGSTEMEMDAAP